MNPLAFRGKSNPKANPLSKQDNLDSFSKQKTLVVGERINHQAANRQVERAKELREFIQLSEEEHFNLFELVPQTKLDRYFDKLQTGSLKTAFISTKDDNVDRDIQTEDLGMTEKYNQYPDDVYQSYNTEGNAQFKQN